MRRIGMPLPSILYIVFKFPPLSMFSNIPQALVGIGGMFARRWVNSCPTLQGQSTTGAYTRPILYGWLAWGTLRVPLEALVRSMGA